MAFSFRILKLNQALNCYRFKNSRTSFGVISKRNGSFINNILPKPVLKTSNTFRITTVGCIGIGIGLYSYFSWSFNKKSNTTNIIVKEKTDYAVNDKIVDIIPSREVFGPAGDIGLDLTLYQYQNCPFCCKVRTFLEYYGIPFKVVEVNPVMRQQLKFSSYKKVPILIVTDKDGNTKYQLNDSSVIVSILGTLLIDIKSGLESVLKYYVPSIYTNADGKEVEEYMNRYFIMYGDKNIPRELDKSLKEERKWRKWADEELVHILSPNIYRTYDEALQAFNYFSEVGEWEKNFSLLERITVIYVGATAMFFVGKKLKKKYALKDDVRQSLYDACHIWMKEIGTKRQFMGGKLPNLADLAVYGLLSSIEGCSAFQDLLKNTNIGPWYYRVKDTVVNHHGFQTLKL